VLDASPVLDTRVSLPGWQQRDTALPLSLRPPVIRQQLLQVHLSSSLLSTERKPFLVDLTIFLLDVHTPTLHPAQSISYWDRLAVSVRAYRRCRSFVNQSLTYLVTHYLCSIFISSVVCNAAFMVQQFLCLTICICIYMFLRKNTM